MPASIISILKLRRWSTVSEVQLKVADMISISSPERMSLLWTGDDCLRDGSCGKSISRLVSSLSCSICNSGTKRLLSGSGSIGAWTANFALFSSEGMAGFVLDFDFEIGFRFEIRVVPGPAAAPFIDVFAFAVTLGFRWERLGADMGLRSTLQFLLSLSSQCFPSFLLVLYMHALQIWRLQMPQRWITVVLCLSHRSHFAVCIKIGSNVAWTSVGLWICADSLCWDDFLGEACSVLHEEATSPCMAGATTLKELAWS